MQTKKSWGRMLGRSMEGLAMAGVVAVLQTWAQPTTLIEFKFDEGSGDVTRSAVNNLVGTLGVPPNPAATPISTTDAPSGAPGDRAVLLDNGAFLLADDSVGPILNLNNSPLTLEGWVKADGTSTVANQGIIAYGGSYKLGISSGQLVFTLFTVADLTSGVFIPFDEWVHVAAVWQPGEGVSFYLNGVLSSFTPETRPIPAFVNNWLNLGAERLGNAIKGSLDRLRVHKAALGAEELDSLATSPKGVLTDTLVAYNFDEAAAPWQSAAATARPTVSGAAVVSQTTAPSWDNDSPSGLPADRSMNFTSSGRRVVVPDPETALRFDEAQPDFTIQAWVRFGAQPGARSVLLFNNGPGGAFSFSVANRRLFVTALGIVDQPSNAAIPDDGGWHHIALVHEANKEFRFYVDGILGDTVPYTRNFLINVRTADFFTIGSEGTGGLPYVGKLDRLMVSSGIVPPEQLDFRPVPGVDPNAPTLSIQTMVEVAWPTLPAGYRLQSTTTPENAASWLFIEAPPFAVDGMFKFYAPTTSPQTFYRVIKE